MPGAGIIGGTIERVHLALSISNVNADTAPGGIVGLIVYDKTVINGSTPQVRTDGDADWMHYRQFAPGLAPNSQAWPTATPTQVLYGIEYDIKSRRILHELNDSLFLCLGNTGTSALQYSALVRTLVRMP